MIVILIITTLIVTALALLDLLAVRFIVATAELDDHEAADAVGLGRITRVLATMCVACALWFWCGLTFRGAW